MPLGQVLYPSCVLPGGSILPVWTEQQAWSRNELCTALDSVNYQVATLWPSSSSFKKLVSVRFVKISETSHPSLM